jgi:hypothetical protein
MANNNASQDKWLAVTIWLGLLVGVGFTSNALMSVFGGIIQTVFQLVQGEMSGLFSNYGALFLAILALVLIFLIFNAWRNMVSLTYELVLAFSGSLDGPVFMNLLDFAKDKENETVDVPKGSLPSAVVRDLAFLWGLFFISFFVLPIFM